MCVLPQRSGLIQALDRTGVPHPCGFRFCALNVFIRVPVVCEWIADPLIECHQVAYLYAGASHPA